MQKKYTEGSVLREVSWMNIVYLATQEKKNHHQKLKWFKLKDAF